MVVPVNIRRALAVAAGRLAGALSRRLGAGGGTAIPGLVAITLDPDLLPHLARQLPQGAILVTGTNGKTTTCRMIAGALQAGGFAPLQNRTGSNLLRGLAATLLSHAGPGGILKAAEGCLGVFEVDEAVLPLAIPLMRPRTVLINNLFRDQLDRYGEVDSIRSLWEEALASLPKDTTVVLNADDPAVASLATSVRGPVLYFGIEDPREGRQGPEHTADFIHCQRCGRAYEYTTSFYAHLGHYRCPQCGAARPTPQVSAAQISFQGFNRTCFKVRTLQGCADVTLNLGGLYNIYNALGATASALALGVPLPEVTGSLARFSPVFGRMESLVIDGRTVCLILVKNPTGFNQALRTLSQGLRPHTVLVVLNDRIADGQDVSWIWDVDFEGLRWEAVAESKGGEANLNAAAGQSLGAAQEPLPQEPSLQQTPLPEPPVLFVSGLRAEDMALRLKYAGLNVVPDSVVGRLKLALDLALKATPEGETLCVLPTYTATLAVQHLLARRGHLPHYWEQG